MNRNASTGLAALSAAWPFSPARRPLSAWLVTGVPQVPPIAVFSASSLLGLLVAVRMFGSVRIDSLPLATWSASDRQTADASGARQLKEAQT